MLHSSFQFLSNMQLMSTFLLAADRPGEAPATKIRFSKGFAFANLDAANEFDEQREEVLPRERGWTITWKCAKVWTWWGSTFKSTWLPSPNPTGCLGNDTLFSLDLRYLTKGPNMGFEP
ncbi:hypothetical protein CEXT_693591 [Caerostris extrusa]|uniref:Uncharacterized protein n=1 Tax=Caerostris extrusa TaxID=172846 RepID=A0AAV4Q855_CAEEX|nr:hypothetical protein CEXT_693591 [Caerostris extrusa]